MLKIIIPAYNEAARIARTIDDYSSFFGDRAKICVVANGCVDSTVEIVSSLMKNNPNLELIEIPFAVGKGGAVRVGLMSGRDAIVGFTDADGSTPAASFATLVDACKSPGVDAAIGSRWISGSTVLTKQSALRRLASRAFNALARLTFGLKYKDTQCGCKVFTRATLDIILPMLELSNFAFDIDILYAMQRMKIAVREMPIVWKDSPGSKVNVARIWFALIVALLRLRLRTGFFREIPYVDLLARSNVIELKEHFRILVIVLRPDTAAKQEDMVEDWAGRVRRSGHEVKVVFVKSLRDAVKMYAWYFSVANGIYDVIVDQNDRLPAWFSLLSAKPRLGSQISRVDDVERVIHDLPFYFGYSQLVFNRELNSWHLIGGTPRKKIRVPEAVAFLGK
jgi:glycosyltransferase involved in cell wall biosynthesis